MMDFDFEEFVLPDSYSESMDDVAFRGSAETDNLLFKSMAKDLSLEGVDSVVPTFNDARTFGDSLTPPEAPFYLQPFTTFESSKSAADFLFECASTMQSMEMTVDFLPQPEKCSITGVVYGARGNEANFTLCVYQGESAGVLAQVCRTDGDAFLFRAFFDNLSSHLNSSSSSSSSSSSPPSDLDTFAFGDMSDLPPLPELQPLSAEVSADEVVQNAMSLASSKWMESAREGLSLLVDMTTDQNAITEVLASPFLASLLSSQIPSADASCGRLSSALLLNILKSPSAPQQFKSLTPVLFECLNREETVYTLQQNRQLSLCLESLLASGATQAEMRDLQCTSEHLSDATAKTILSALLERVAIM